MLEREIRAAKRGAYTFKEFEKVNKTEQELCRAFISGEILLADFRRETDALPKAGILFVDTLEKLRSALEAIGLDRQLIEACISHEEKHFIKAQEVGFVAQYGVGFTKPNRNSYFKNITTAVTIPEGFTDEDARIALRSIIEVPGEDMSPGDIASLPQH